MAGGAIGHPPGVQNPVMREEALLFTFRQRLCGVHVKDLLWRNQVRAGIAMTGQTPTHLKGSDAGGERHLVNTAVAFLAGNSVGYMGAVVEIDEVG